MNRHEQLDYLINYLIDEHVEDIDIPNDYESRRVLLRSLMNIRLPLSISDEFLKIQDDFLSSETLNKQLTTVDDINEVNGKLMLWKGDITTLKVDAIVNAANSKLLGCFIPNHNCIDNAIHSASGLQLRAECNQIMKAQGHDEEVGNAKITKAYNLPSKYVIHTVGPQIPLGLKPSKKDCSDLKRCYESCLKIADLKNLKSVAFCSISTGVFNFPQDLACKIAIKTTKSYLDNNNTSLEHIIFNVFSDDSYKIYKGEITWTNSI